MPLRRAVLERRTHRRIPTPDGLNAVVSEVSNPIVNKYRASVGDLDTYTFCGQKITEYSLEDLRVICAVAMNRMREDSERHQAQMATLAGLRKC